MRCRYGDVGSFVFEVNRMSQTRFLFVQAEIVRKIRVGTYVKHTRRKKGLEHVQRTVTIVYNDLRIELDKSMRF